MNATPNPSGNTGTESGSERDILQPEMDDADPDTPAEPRGWLPTALIVLATVLAVVSATTTWVRTQALDTDQWVDASSEILDAPEVREALAVYVTDELYANVDVAAELESVLPDGLGGLAPLIAGSLRQPATDAVERLLGADAVATAWRAANQLAHETLVAIVRDETRENVSTADGTVVLDLGGIVRTVGERLGLPENVLDRIPPDAGVITVFESDELSSVQELVRVLDFLSWFLFVVVVALYALAVYLARDRRRALLQVGVALVVGGVVLLATRQFAVQTLTDEIVEDPANRGAAALVADVATELLRQMAWTGILAGVLIALVAMLLGPGRAAVSIRRAIRGTGHTVAVLAGAAVLLLMLLVWWSPGRMFDRWVTATTVIVLLVAAVVALARAVDDDIRSVDRPAEPIEPTESERDDVATSTHATTDGD